MPPAPTSDPHRRPRRKAAPTAARRPYVILLTGLLLVGFCASVKTSQIRGGGGASAAPVDPFAQTALDAIFSDLKQEIVAGSNAVTVPISGGSTTIYTPTIPATFVPYRVGTTDALLNLIKRSVNGQPFYSGSGYTDTGSNRAASEPSTNASLNGRAVSLARWNRSLLLPKQNPVSDVDLTPDAAFAAPAWIFNAADGSNPTVWDGSLTASGSNPVIGRYAYTIYDEGGLLDLNVAGSPTGTSAQQTAYKSSLASADLTQLGLTQSQIDALVAWRAAHPAAGRLDFIDFFNKTVATSTNTRASLQNSLQYLGSFSRELSQPAYMPEAGRRTVTASSSAGGNDAVGTPSDPSSASAVNPPFLNVRVAYSTFIRSDSTPGVVGEPLVKQRFLLQRLAWLTYKGPSALRNIPNSNPGEDDPDADMWNLANNGISQIFLQQGTAANIQKYFGLTWNGSGWTYTPANHPGSSNLAIRKLADIANDATRQDDPDFIELLRASVNVGSIAKAATTSPTAIRKVAAPGWQDYNNDTSTNYAIIQMAANIIDQYDGDGFPTKITYNFRDFYGVENLPYMYRVQPGLLKVRESNPATAVGMQYTTVSHTGTSALKDTGLVMMLALPEVWNPHDKNAPLGAPRPKDFGVYGDSAGLAHVSNYYAFDNNTSIYGSTNSSSNMASANPTASPPIPGFGPAYASTASLFNPKYKREALTQSNSLLTFSVPTGNNALFREPTLLVKPGKPAGSNLSMPDATVSSLESGRLKTIARDSSGSPAWTGQGFLSVQTNPLRLAPDEPGYSSTEPYVGIFWGIAPLRWVTTTSGGSTIPPTICTAYTYAYPADDSAWVTSFITAYKDSSGAWVEYDRKGMPVSAAWLFPPLGSGVPTNRSSTSQNDQLSQSSLIQYEAAPNTVIDPRTSRFGSMNGDHVPGQPYIGPNGPAFVPSVQKGSWIDSDNMVRTTDRPDIQGGYGTASRTDNRNGVSWGSQAGMASWGWHIRGTSIVSGGWPRPGLFTQNIPSFANDGLRYSGDASGAGASDPQYYADPDGVVRRAMGAYASGGSVRGLPMARAQEFAAVNAPAADGEARTSQSRPWILNRPFRSVGELGYVFSGTPWRNLDFSTPESGYSALLDVFTVAENQDSQSLVAGKVNLNTRQTLVLKAILSGAYKDAQNVASGTISSTEADAIANALYYRTTSADPLKGPIANPSQLVGRFNQAVTITGNAVAPVAPFNIDGSKSYVGFSNDLDTALTSVVDKAIPRFREASIRPLANLCQSRVWNLMIDLVAQTGSYPAEATALNQFNVDAEHRYWMHVAIDRYTGAVLDQSLEEVFDAPTDIALTQTSVEENQPAGAVVGGLSAAGPIPGRVYSFALASGTGSDDNGAFTVAGGILQTTATFHRVLKSNYSVRLRVTDQDGLSFEKPFVIAVVPNPYMQWKSAYFPGQENNPLISGDAADPDHDGLPNLLEYALGKSPMSADTAGLAVQTSGNVVTLSYTRLTAATDVTMHAYWTGALDDPASWSMSGVTETMVSDDGTIQHWQASVLLNGASKLFLRLQATRP